MHWVMRGLKRLLPSLRPVRAPEKRLPISLPRYRSLAPEKRNSSSRLPPLPCRNSCCSEISLTSCATVNWLLISHLPRVEGDMSAC